MSSNMPSRTPTLTSQHSASSKVKPPPSSSSSHSLPHNTALDGNLDSPKGKGSGASTPTGSKKAVAGGQPQQGMVAPLELSRWRFWAVFISLMIAIFLFALGTSHHYLPSITETCKLRRDSRSIDSRDCYSKDYRGFQQFD